MSFGDEINRIKDKSTRRLNISRILSNRSWNLTIRTLRAVYFSLVRSLTEYDFFIYECLSKKHKTELAIIQNKSLRIITRNPFGTITENEVRCKVEPIGHRLEKLMRRYVKKNVNNPLIRTLQTEYRRGFESRSEQRTTPLTFMKDEWRISETEH